MSEWKVLVRGADRRFIGEVSGEHSLEIIERHLALGSWIVTVDAASQDARLLREGKGIVFVRDGAIAFSGPTRQIERAMNADEGGHGTLTASGPCDKGWLTRLVWPNPATTIPAAGATQSPARYKVPRTGTGTVKSETALRQLVNDHAGPGALASRQVPGLRLQADQGRGAATAVSSRFGVLWDELVAIALRGGLGFDVVQSWDGFLDFKVYAGRLEQAAPAARFSLELGNLRSYQYTLTPPEVTSAIVGDLEGGTSRKFYGFDTAADALWPGLRVEEFVDGTDASGDTSTEPAPAPADLAGARLEEARGKASVTFEAIDIDSVKLGRDYRKGSTVTVEVDGEPYTDLVQEIRYTRTPDEGQVVVPVIGNDEESPRIYQRLAQLQRKVHIMQTRR
ncbi:hypothetical protein ACIBF1_14935 [Spirillospora sp. NPDC050679]